MFFSTFYATKSVLGNNYTMPSLDDFANKVIKEKDELIHMGTIKSSKSHALTENYGIIEQRGPPKKEKKQKYQVEKNREKKFLTPRVVNGASSSKNNKPKKERTTCSYCKKLGHDEHKCMKKKIDHLSHRLKRNNIKVSIQSKQIHPKKLTRNQVNGKERVRP